MGLGLRNRKEWATLAQFRRETIYALSHLDFIRSTCRNSTVFRTGAYGNAARAKSLHARCAALLPTAVRQRFRGSAVLATKPSQTEQELPKGVCKSRHVKKPARYFRSPLVTPSAVAFSAMRTPLCPCPSFPSDLMNSYFVDWIFGKRSISQI